MSSAQIKIHIAAKEADLDKTKAALKAHDDHMNYLISVFEQEIYELNVKLQLAEADETFVPYTAADDTPVSYTAAQAAAEDTEVNELFAKRDDGQEEVCYHCGYNMCHGYYSCRCASAPDEEEVENAFEEGQRLNAEAPAISYARTEGTKLKWVSDANPETYRVAIVKKDGILEVKRVTDGDGYCHDHTICRCFPCREIALSQRLGSPLPPWRPRAPLTKTFFATEGAWRISLPFGGKITVTEPQLSDRALRALCMKPLTAITDAGRLKELEERFPGATMVLSTKDRQYEIAYNQDPVYGNIHCEGAHISAPYFASFGPSTNGKPNLMAEWRGLYIGLDHLF